MFIAFELDTQPRDLGIKLTLNNCQSDVVKLTTTSAGVGFDASSQFLKLSGEFGKNAVFWCT